MLRNFKNTAFAAVFLAVFPGLGFPRDHDACALPDLEGSWGITVTGTLFLPGGAAPPFATVGKLTFDAFGNMKAKQTNSAGGVISNDESVLGTVQKLDPDCTGTFSVRVEDATGNVLRMVTFDFVVDDDATEIRALATSMVRGGVSVAPVLTFNARKMFYGKGSN